MVFNVNHLTHNYKLNGEIKLSTREDKTNKNVMDTLYCWTSAEPFLVKNKVELCQVKQLQSTRTINRFYMKQGHGGKKLYLFSDAKRRWRGVSPDLGGSEICEINFKKVDGVVWKISFDLLIRATILELHLHTGRGLNLRPTEPTRLAVSGHRSNY